MYESKDNNTTSNEIRGQVTECNENTTQKRNGGNKRDHEMKLFVLVEHKRMTFCFHCRS
jgi:hypothetical protein